MSASEKGLERFLAGDIEGAIRHWTEALRQRPNDESLRAYLEQALSARQGGAARAPLATTALEAALFAASKARTAATESANEDGWGNAGEVVAEVSKHPQALELVSHHAPPPKSQVPQDDAERDGVEALVGRLRQCLELDDFSKALAVAEQILERDSYHQGALAAKKRCREKLLQAYLSKIGGGRAIPKLAMSARHIIWQNLDHRAGFVMSQVDGVSSFDEIAQVVGFDELETFGIFVKLLKAGVLSV